MILNDAVCNECGAVFTVSKKFDENWSEMEFQCPECASNNTSVKFGIGDVDVARGIHGNGHTKYDREFSYKPSRFGKFRGKKIK